MFLLQALREHLHQEAEQFMTIMVGLWLEDQ